MQDAYRVVKFIVNVRVVEKRVNSHVGRVIVVNVIVQYSSPGMTRSTASITLPRMPNVEVDAVSIGLMAGTDASRASTVLASTAEETEVVVAAASMVACVVGESPPARCGQGGAPPRDKGCEQRDVKASAGMVLCPVPVCVRVPSLHPVACEASQLSRRRGGMRSLT